METSTPEQRSLRFGILGPLLVEGSGGPISIASGRQRAILGVLLMSPNRVVSVERLIDEIWGSEPPDSVEGAIQTHVSSLRKLLEPARGPGSPATVLVTQPPGYLLRVSPENLDILEFERFVRTSREHSAAGRHADAVATYDQALSLWRGPALGGVEADSAVRVEAARLEEVRLTAVAERTESLLAAGRHDEAVGELEALVARHPERERLCGLLMLALYRAGRQQESLDHYRATRTHLRDELGLEPGTPLQRLEAAILRQDVSLDATAPQARAAAGNATGPAHETDRVIVVATVGDGDPHTLLAVAEPLARSQSGRELIVARLLIAGSASAGAITEHSRSLSVVASELERRGVPTRAVALTTPDPGEDAVRLASSPDVDLILVETDGGGDGPSPVLSTILTECPCDVAILQGGAPPDFDGSAFVAVPVSGAESDWSAIEMAAWIARSTGGTLRFVGTRSATGDGRDASRLLANASLLTQRFLGVSAEPAMAEPSAAGIAAAADGAALIVVGVSDRWRVEGIGEARRELAARVACPTLFVRRGVRPGALDPPGTLTRFAWSLSPGS